MEVSGQDLASLRLCHQNAGMSADVSSIMRAERLKSGTDV